MLKLKIIVLSVYGHFLETGGVTFTLPRSFSTNSVERRKII